MATSQLAPLCPKNNTAFKSENLYNISLPIFCIIPNPLLFYCILRPFSISTMIGGAFSSSRAEIICIFDVLFTERLPQPPAC